MIRFGAIVSVVAVAMGLLIVGAVAGDLTLVYVSIGLAALALLMLIAGVVIWRDELFGAGAGGQATRPGLGPIEAGLVGSSAPGAGAGQSGRASASSKPGAAAERSGAADGRSGAAEGPRARGAAFGRTAQSRGGGDVAAASPGRGSPSRSSHRSGSRPAQDGDTRAAAVARPGVDREQRERDQYQWERDHRERDERERDHREHDQRERDQRDRDQREPDRRQRDQREREHRERDQHQHERPALVEGGSTAGSGIAPASGAEAPPERDAAGSGGTSGRAAAAGPTGHAGSNWPDRPSAASGSPFFTAARTGSAGHGSETSSRKPATDPLLSGGRPARPPLAEPSGGSKAADRPDASRTGAYASASAPASTAVTAGKNPAPASPISALPAPVAAREADIASPGGASADRASGSAPSAPSDAMVSVVPGIARYHTIDCILIRFLSSDDLEIMTQQAAEATGCVPCRACRPEKPGATA